MKAIIIVMLSVMFACGGTAQDTIPQGRDLGGGWAQEVDGRVVCADPTYVTGTYSPASVICQWLCVPYGADGSRWNISIIYRQAEDGSWYEYHFGTFGECES